MKIGKTSAPVNVDNQHIDTLIGEHSSFKGELDFEGAVRIDGKFEGNLRSKKDGTLIISESAHVVGEIDVPNLILHGDMRGNTRASKTLKIGVKGRLNGDVEYTVITMVEGATINGRCSRLTDADQVKKAPKPDLPAQPKMEAVQTG